MNITTNAAGNLVATCTGRHTWTLELFRSQPLKWCIEWDCPNTEQHAEIGIWLEGKTHARLTDYDGVYALPKEAVKLLRAAGVIVGKEFTT